MNEQKKKRDLKTILKTFLTGAVIAAVTVSLAGCAFNPILDKYYGNNDNQYSITEEYEKTEYNDSSSSYVPKEPGISYNTMLYDLDLSMGAVINANTFGIGSSRMTDNADRRLQEGPYVSVPISLSQANYNTFANWVRSKDVTYVYADLYNVDYTQSQIDEYQTQISNQEHIHTDLITSTNKIPTQQMIYNKILNNNSKYLSQNPGYYKLDNSYITTISTQLESILKDIYSDLDKTDIERIYCMLNDVVVVGIDSTDFKLNDLEQVYNARVTEDAVVMLDTKQIAALEGENTIERTIVHEVVHLFQRMCPDHQIKGLTQIGNSQYVDRYDETKEAVNSLHFQWLYEAAAEKISMNQYDAKTPLVYTNMVGYLNTLDLITLIRPDYNEQSIAISQMSTNPDAIYEVFGAKTEEEKKEIAHMLFSICYIQTEREDFATVYKQENGEIIGQETTIKKIMKESVAQTMTKYFYLNLSERVANGNIDLQDAFYLINTFEGALNRHLEYAEEERLEYTNDALSFYIQTQNKFFELVAESSGMTYEDIVTKFNDYALVIKTDNTYSRNYSLSWLTEDEKEFIGNMLTMNISDLTLNIRNLDFVENRYTK